MNESPIQSITPAIKQDIIAIKQDIADLEAQLSQKIGGIGSEMFKWMLIFWIAQNMVTFGGLLLFLKK